MSHWQVKAHDLLHHQATMLAELLNDINPDDPATRQKLYRTTAGGDERKLRGIPAIGRGVGGAQQGLRPGDDASRAAGYVTRIA